MRKKNKPLLDWIKKKIGRIKIDPHEGKPLTGIYKNCFSVRLDKYGLIYTLDKTKKIITLLDFGNRGTIYHKGAIEIALSKIKKSKEKSP